MNQQNKTEVKCEDENKVQQTNEVQQIKLFTQTQNQQNHKVKQHDESRIQIVMMTRKGHDEHQKQREQQIDQNQIKRQQNKIQVSYLKSAQLILKQSDSKGNEEDISAVYINLNSEHQTYDRKWTINSVIDIRSLQNSIQKNNIIHNQHELQIRQEELNNQQINNNKQNKKNSINDNSIQQQIKFKTFHDQQIQTSNQRIQIVNKQVIGLDKVNKKQNKQFFQQGQQIIKNYKQISRGNKQIGKQQQIKQKQIETIKQSLNIIRGSQKIVIIQYDQQVIQMNKQVIKLDKQVIQMDKQVIELDKQVIVMNKQVIELDKQVIVMNKQVIQLDKQVVVIDKNDEQYKIQILPLQQSVLSNKNELSNKVDRQAKQYKLDEQIEIKVDKQIQVNIDINGQVSNQLDDKEIQNNNNKELVIDDKNSNLKQTQLPQKSQLIQRQVNEINEIIINKQQLLSYQQTKKQQLLLLNEQYNQNNEQINNYLSNIKDNQYDQIIIQLTSKLSYLQSQYHKLIYNNDIINNDIMNNDILNNDIINNDNEQKQNNIINLTHHHNILPHNLSIQPNLQKYKLSINNQILSFSYIHIQQPSSYNLYNQSNNISNNPSNIISNNLSHNPSNIISHQYNTSNQQHQIPNTQNISSQSNVISQQNITPNLNQSSQFIQSLNNISPKSYIINNQFSSGQIQNLMAQSQQQLIDLKDLQSPQQYNSNHQQSHLMHHKLSNQQLLSQIHVLQSSNLYVPPNSTQSNPFYLPILSISQSNLATIKQSYQELPYQRFRTIMKLDSIVSKISFKEKHYPSSKLTQKQIKLYGKRLFRLLGEQFNQKGIQKYNSITLENDMEFDKLQQCIVYYIKNNPTFVIICYFNHTIYIGQYITHRPKQQITRQGYGIQIRQYKYIYQGQFFADKKHGYGFVQFIGKNPFIYSGYFLDGFMDGHGKSMSQNGEIYIGDYKLGQRDGVGKLMYNSQKYVFYQGQFYDGYKHGKGQQFFQNGDSYLGSYSKDKFEGMGEYKWKNGTIYQGTFIDGYKHGQGVLIFTNGSKFDKYYDHNKQINLDNSDDKKTIKTSRISTFSQSKVEEKTLIQEKPIHLRKMRSMSGQSLFSYNSKPKQKSLKMSKQKKKIADLLREKQIQQDLKNLNSILKDPVDEGKLKKIFSVKKIDTKDKIIGKMYNTTQRPSIKLSENKQLDLLKLSKLGSQRKSLISFDSQDRLQQLKDSFHQKRVRPTTNFSQF